MRNFILTALVSVALATGSANRVRADAGDTILGVIIGAGIGAAVSNSKKKRSSKRRTSKRKKYKKPSARRGDAQVQRALNHFSYEAGTPDGLFGKRTRAAIRKYQTALGEAATGRLTASQKSRLLAAYAQSGAPNGNNFGPQNGGTSAGFTTLLASLGSQQNDGSNATGSNTAFEVKTNPLEAPTSPRMALCQNEPKPRGALSYTSMDTLVGSYCRVMEYSIARSAKIAQETPGYDAATSQAQCNAWMTAQKPIIEAALAQGPDAAIASLKAQFANVGAAQLQAMSNGFAICQGIAEAQGNPDMSKGFSALLAAFGQPGYGEIVAASTALGAGATQSPEGAYDWYLWTAEALLVENAPQLIAVEGYDHVPLLLALGDSAKEVTQDWQSYAAGQSKAGSTAAVGGLALPGMAAVTEAKVDLHSSPLIPANFEEIYGLAPAQALQACRIGGDAVAELGRRVCRTLAKAANDPALESRYQ